EIPVRPDRCADVRRSVSPARGRARLLPRDGGASAIRACRRERSGRTMARLKILAAAALALSIAAPAGAYSVLAHEANVDALGETGIRPLLHQRFPRATVAQLAAARAYAYGGSVIQDLGYYPFGNQFFSNLAH